MSFVADMALLGGGLFCWTGVTVMVRSFSAVLDAVGSSVGKDMMTWFALASVCGGALLVSGGE